MKKLLTILLAVALLCGVFGPVTVRADEGGDLPPADIDPGLPPEGDPEQPPEEEPEQPEDLFQTQTPEEHQGVVSLDGKTVMIVGNSMVYYGNCVIHGDTGKEDYGYFYQLAAANDEKVTVLDHTYSGKKLDYIYENYLVKLSQEVREQVDYLVLSEGNQYNDDLVGTCERILALFPEDVEFRFLRQPMMFESDLPCLIEGVAALREKGYQIVDWGKLVYDIHSGAVEVPGATLEFKRSSFMKENLGYNNGPGTILNPDKKGDRNHENPLSGYVTAQMLYTSLTNRSAVLTDYTFCYDTTIHPYFDIDGFAKAHYTGPEKTNFHEIFRSPQDMLGLQQLIDLYLRREGRHPLTVQKAVKPTCNRGGMTHGSFCAPCEAVVETQQFIPADAGEHQLVFTPGVAQTCTENGLTPGISCETCGHILQKPAVVPYTGHMPQEQFVRATTKAAGYRQSVCIRCDTVLARQDIPQIASVKLSQTSYVYNGLEQKPTVTVTDTAGNTLVEGIDYTLTYSSGRILVKNYKVTVKFAGNYKGTHELVYKIRPGRVGNFTAAGYLKSVKLTWQPVEQATHYRIYLYDSATKSYKKLTDTTGLSYKVTGLKTGTKYKFRITAYTVAADRTYYAAKNRYVTTVTRPAKVNLKAVTSKKKGTVTVTWEQRNADGYEITYSRYKSFKKVTKITVTDKDTLTATVKRLTSGKGYSVKVRAYKILDGKKVYGYYSKAKRVRSK